MITATFYFQHHPTTTANGECVWKLRTSAEYSALGALARSL